MKRHQRWSMVWRVAPIAMVVGLADVSLVQAQGPPPPPERHAAVVASDEQQATGMMAEFQQILAALQTSDQTLNELIARIETARGDDDKIDAVTAVLKEMVRQRTQMREQIVAKAQQMTAHMREHMSGGMQGMMNCPMMKELAKPAEAEHSPHHPEN